MPPGRTFGLGCWIRGACEREQVQIDGTADVGRAILANVAQATLHFRVCEQRLSMDHLVHGERLLVLRHYKRFQFDRSSQGHVGALMEVWIGRHLRGGAHHIKRNTVHQFYPEDCIPLTFCPALARLSCFRWAVDASPTIEVGIAPPPYADGSHQITQLEGIKDAGKMHEYTRIVEPEPIARTAGLASQHYRAQVRRYPFS